MQQDITGYSSLVQSQTAAIGDRLGNIHVQRISRQNMHDFTDIEGSAGILRAISSTPTGF